MGDSSNDVSLPPGVSAPGNMEYYQTPNSEKVSPKQNPSARTTTDVITGTSSDEEINEGHGKEEKRSRSQSTMGLTNEQLAKSRPEEPQLPTPNEQQSQAQAAGSNSGYVSASSVGLNKHSSVEASTGSEESKVSLQSSNTSAISGEATGATRDSEKAGALGASSKVTEENKWLSGNLLTAFIIAYTIMAVMARRLLITMGRVEVEGMKMVYAIGTNISSTIIASSQEEAKMHIAQAVTAGISLAATVGTAAFSIYMMKGSYAAATAETSAAKAEMNTAKVKMDNAEANYNANQTPALQQKHAEKKAEYEQAEARYSASKANTWTSFSQKQQTQMIFADVLRNAVDQGGKMISEIIQAEATIEKGKYDALRAMLETYQTIAKKYMETGAEGFKMTQDQIMQMWQQFQKMDDQMTAAGNKAISG